jgi:transcription termination factor NusB
VSAAEYPALLKEVYRRADIPKPRNLVGLAKDLSTADSASFVNGLLARLDEAKPTLV